MANYVFTKDEFEDAACELQCEVENKFNSVFHLNFDVETLMEDIMYDFYDEDKDVVEIPENHTFIVYPTNINDWEGVNITIVNNKFVFDYEFAEQLDEEAVEMAIDEFFYSGRF